MGIDAGIGTGLVVGGLLDYLGGQEYNKALQEKTAADQAMAAKKEGRALGTLGTSGTAFTTRNLNQSGGSDEKQLGGATAAKVRSAGAAGDLQRQLESNALTRDFKFNIPDMATAQGMVDRDSILAQGLIDQQYNKATLREQQKPLGRGSSDYNANLMDAMGRVSDKTRFNREQEAVELLRKSQEGDVNNLIKELQARQLHFPAPQYQDRTPGATAAQIITQMPTRDFAVNASPLGLGAKAGSNLVGQLMAYEQTEADRRAQADLIRQLGDAGAFKGTTVPLREVS